MPIVSKIHCLLPGGSLNSDFYLEACPNKIETSYFQRVLREKKLCQILGLLKVDDMDLLDYENYRAKAFLVILWPFSAQMFGEKLVGVLLDVMWGCIVLKRVGEA